MAKSNIKDPTRKGYEFLGYEAAAGFEVGVVYKKGFFSKAGQRFEKKTLVQAGDIKDETLKSLIKDDVLVAKFKKKESK